MFRFTIRDVLWLTVVVGLTIAWTMRERQLKSQIAAAMQWREKARGLQSLLEHDGWQIAWKTDGIIDAVHPGERKNVRLDYRERP